MSPVAIKEKMQNNLSLIRNIGFIAHIDAGKTTTTERVLFYSGKTYKIGEVDEGTTVCDWMSQEKERGITITSAATYCRWGNYHINIIDTPGHIDFTAEVERSLKVLDGCVLILCGVGGVEPQSETVWRQADKYNIPRIAFVNKMDRVGADFFEVIKEMEEKLHITLSPLQLPFYEEGQFKGVIDLLNLKLILYYDEQGLDMRKEEIPHFYQEEAKIWRDKLIDRLSELDDELINKVVNGENISPQYLISLIRKYVLRCEFLPVLCGSALKNKGIQPLLDAVCNWLPSPLDKKFIEGLDRKEESILRREVSYNSLFCGLCFKVFNDPYVGKLFYIRIYSGEVNTGSYVYNSVKKTKEKITKILKMHANKQEIINHAKAGDIVCFVGLKVTTTGDTLCDEKEPIILSKIPFPEPVARIAIEPKTKADEEKLISALRRLEDEDPSFKVYYNPETGQNIIAGMGKLHLDIMVDRLKREFNIEARTGNPQVNYKETITRQAEAVGKFIQQSGGRGHYGDVVFIMSPLQRGGGIVFENKIKGGAIPKEFIPSIKEGVLEASDSGILGGYPTVDIKCVLIDGSYHEVDSSPLAFKTAAEIAFKEGLRKGAPIILEPIMSLEIIVPSEYLSAVIADLNIRRGKVQSISERKKLKILRAEVPLKEVFDYADILRNLTQGRATYTAEPLCYEKVPDDILAKILGQI